MRSLVTDDGIEVLAPSILDDLHWTHPERTSLVVERVLTNQDIFRSVHNGSMWHANGFAKVALGRLGECRMRLHFWANTEADDPHSHRWPLIGRVLAGELREHFYDEVAEGRGSLVRHLCGRTTVDRSVFEVRPDRPVQLRRTGSRRLRTGDVHRLEVTDIHSIRAACLPTFTSVVTGKPTARLSRLYRQNRTDSSGPAEQPTAAELRSLLTEIRDTVSSSPSRLDQGQRVGQVQ